MLRRRITALRKMNVRIEGGQLTNDITELNCEVASIHVTLAKAVSYADSINSFDSSNLCDFLETVISLSDRILRCMNIADIIDRIIAKPSHEALIFTDVYTTILDQQETVCSLIQKIQKLNPSE